MVKVSVLYPHSPGCRFDMDYYCTRHMPMVADRLGAACQGVAVDEGVGAGPDGSSPPFVAMAHLYFESEEAFHRSFDPQAREIMADVPNYTDIQPVLLVSNVRINAGRGETGRLHLHDAGR